MNLNRTGRVGALCLVAAAPVFLVANLVTGLRWQDPTYSWATNNISDLGNVHCGIWDTTRPRYVCSPWHPLMNTAMLATAALLAVGLLLTWRILGRGGVVRSAQALLLLATIGYALAARYPADVDENLHVLGAFLIMGVGNIGLLLAGFAPGSTLLGRWRRLTLAAGLTALVGTVLFAAQQGVGIGVGGMERIAVLPFPLWACCAGVLLAETPTPAPGAPAPPSPALPVPPSPRRSWSCGARFDQ
ncbi:MULTISPECIES: DUF998 domain-containing protein [Micromonospora]|uniref:DUF998 domain-containing protein n=1 Tax=Micromonospora profundi TaxID=1420889 RepID=A0AAJ6L5I4_9ACTN|nr:MULTISPECIES: DUF998 domain-containing protein [Micromonospora]WLS47206.1 DUF998 domain-containing protein [Micromonospora profundi]